MFVRLIVVLIVLLNVWFAASYNVGVGIYDMTGPAAEINFMGYAVPNQRGSGIHLRLRARSYVMDDGNKRVAFVSVDGGMASDLVKQKVVEYVNAKLGSNVYTLENLSISGTHSHSGPAGFLQYVLFQVTSFGFVKETFDAWVNGIGESVLMAHHNVKPANIMVNSGKLYNSNINRSPTSYLLNPAEERAKYPDGDTDKTMLLLKFTDQSTNKNLGVLNWFAVHGTSMNNTNTLISGDNRGYASYKLEKFINGDDSVAGMGPFVAAFASTNLGDVSPNTNGAKCIDTGLPCDGTKSTCNGRCENCIAFGPGKNGDMFESTQIIGNNQYEFAKQLMDSATEFVNGKVDYRHSFVDMSKLNVTLSDGTVKSLCNPAMGYAFAAGTTDGPGMFGFTQGTTTSNPFWNKVAGYISTPTQEEIDCQAPKPILINTGGADVPYQWDPKIVPLQIFRVGNVFILSVPGEFTTMSGRRLREAVQNRIRASGIIPADQEIYVTIAGLANSYASYIATYEEYQAQRYEAASTIYGPHTLDGYIQEFLRLTDDLVSGKPSASYGMPPDLSDVQVELMPAPGPDVVPKNASFGDIIPGYDVLPSYKVGESVQVKFYSANPRHDQRIQGTFLTVEMQVESFVGVRYSTVATDGDWETKFHWQAGKNDPLALSLIPFSHSTITWDIPQTAKAGSYRICHYGNYKKPKLDKIFSFQGCSSTFQVV